jgi:hypothetical protein
MQNLIADKNYTLENTNISILQMDDETDKCIMEDVFNS